MQVITQGYQEDAQTREQFKVEHSRETDTALIAECLPCDTGETADLFAHARRWVSFGKYVHWSRIAIEFSTEVIRSSPRDETKSNGDTETTYPTGGLEYIRETKHAYSLR